MQQTNHVIRRYILAGTDSRNFGEKFRVMELIGIIFILVGLWQIVFSTRVRTLTCERVDRNQCIYEILESGLLWSKVLPLYELQGADIKRETGFTGATPAIPYTYYQVVLHARRSVVPFTLKHTLNCEKQEAIACEINSFVSNLAQKSLTVREDIRFFLIVQVL